MVDHVTHRVRGQLKERTADIKSMIITWTQENKNSHWSEGLRFVQFQKNRSYHRTIEQTPYKALFGSDPKVGLSSSAIPKELLDTLETEEDLNSVVVAVMKILAQTLKPTQTWILKTKNMTIFLQKMQKISRMLCTS